MSERRECSKDRACGEDEQRRRILHTSSSASETQALNLLQWRLAAAILLIDPGQQWWCEMPISFYSGDIFVDPNAKSFAHGCNCAGAMGRGIAVAFREKWPKMYQAYKKACDNKQFDLGDVFGWHDLQTDVTVFNLATQKSWRTKANMEAIRVSIEDMIEMAEDLEISEVVMPAIGAGLGGADWNEIKAILIEFSATTDVHLKVCEEYVAGQELRLIS